MRRHLSMPLLVFPLFAADAAVAAEETTRRRAAAVNTWDADGGRFHVTRPQDMAIISRNLDGPGTLHKTGAGTVRLTGTNTYTGGTIISDGALRIGDGRTRGSVVGDIVNDGLLEFDRADDVVFGGRISGRGTVHYIGSGAFTLTADQPYPGITVNGGGPLAFGDGGDAGSVAGDIYNHGALVFNRRNTLVIPGTIHGYGAVIQAGTGTTVLLGDNHYVGFTEVRRGTLVVEGDQHNAPGPVTVLPGATLAGGGSVGGNVFVEPGGTLAADRPGGTLSMQQLVMRPGATLRVRVDDPVAESARAGKARIAVARDVTLDGTLDVAAGPGTSRYRGLYRLVSYGGTLDDRGLDIGAVPAGTRREAWRVHTARPGRIDLVHDDGLPLRFWHGDAAVAAGVAAEDPAREGGGDGVWRAGGAPQWSDNGVDTDSAWPDQAMAIFGGRAGTVTVDDRAGPVRFAAMQFITDGYAIAGPGALTTNAADAELRVGDGGAGDGALRAVLDADLDGRGRVVKTGGGTLALGGVNRHAGGTRIEAGTLEIRHDRNLGAPQGPLAFDGGRLRAQADIDGARPVAIGPGGGTIDTGSHTVRWTGALSGPGGLVKTGSGTLDLGGANATTGALRVAAGTLRAAAPGALGPASRVEVAPGAILDTAGAPQTIAGLANAGTVTLASHTPGTTLTVRGDYVGHGGVLRLATTLGGSDSATDRLVIDGGHASGRTTVDIINVDGLGGATRGDGIEVIRALNDATTTAQTTRDGFALLGDHVDAGAYEYRLYPGDANGAGESWFLRSTAPVTLSADATAGPAATRAAAYAGAAAAARPSYRPQVALYSALPATLAQGDLAMLGNRHRRVGDDGGPGAAAPAADADASRRRTWARVIDQDTRIRQQGTVAPRSHGWASGAQVGADLYAAGRHRAGLYGGTLGWRHAVHGDAAGDPDRAVGRLQGRSNYAGLYWTYLADGGWYGDLTVQHGRQRGNARAATGGDGDIRAHSTLASLELGLPLPLGAGWRVEPQAQLIAIDRRIDDATIPAATLDFHAGTAVVGRLGLRVKGDHEGRHGRAQPYARANVWHGLPGTDTQRVQGPGGETTIGARRGYTSGELAAGGTWAVNRHVGLYGELGRLFALGGGQRVSASHTVSAGLRIAW